MNNSKVGSIKRNITIFLTIVLVTGTIAISFSSSSSFMTANAQAQSSYYGNNNGYESQYQLSYKPDYNEPQYPPYGRDNNYEKSKDISKSISVKKIKCINDNININGENAGNVSIGNKGQGYLSAYSSGVSGYGDETNNKQGKGIDDCIINNNNTNINFGGNQTKPPEEPTATLNITKVIECRETGTSPTPGILCQELLPLITEDQFLFQVQGNNPSPSSQFPGSEAGTIVTLDAGNYIVSETLDEAGITELNNFRTNHPSIDILFVNAVFTGDCTETVGIPFPNAEATGTIAAGESQTCNVKNVLEIIF